MTESFHSVNLNIRMKFRFFIGTIISFILALYSFSPGYAAYPNPPYLCNENCSLNPGGCSAGLTCSGGQCRNPSCTVETGCNCSYEIKGRKVKAPNQTGVAPFDSQTITLDSGPNSTGDPYSFPGQSANRTVSTSVPAGSSVEYTLCYNNEACHSGAATAGSSVAVDSNQASVNGSASDYASIYWHFTPLTPNCKNINAPSSVLNGDTVSISAAYEDDGGPLTALPAGAITVYDTPGGCLSGGAVRGNQLSPNEGYTGPGTYTFNWTASTTGNYTAYCRAWNNATAECRGNASDCVDGPPRYGCDGSDGSGTTATSTMTVNNPGPWYKVKDTSLYKFGDIDVSVVQNINKFTDADADDDSSQRYIMMGTAGVGIAQGSVNTGPSYAPITLNQQQKQTSSYNMLQPYLTNFFSYIRSRKLSTTITSLGADIQANQINFADVTYPYTLNGASLSGAPATTILVFSGNIVIDGNFNVTGINNNPEKSVAIITSGTITFSQNTVYANGVFIGNNIVVENSASGDGLKIKGNLISSGSTLNRTRTDNTRPSMFIVFDPQQYLDLLPYISVDKYDQSLTN